MNKEQVYDEQIHPLMTQIIDICEANNIKMIFDAEIPNDTDPNLCVTTHLVGVGDASNRHAACRRLLLSSGAMSAVVITSSGPASAEQVE